MSTWGSVNARRRMIAAVGAVLLGLLVALVLIVGAHGGTVAASGAFTPTPTSSIAPNVQLISTEIGTQIDAQNNTLVDVGQYTFVAGKGAVNVLVSIQFTTEPALTSFTPVDTVSCQTYLDNSLVNNVTGGQWDVTGGTINNSHVLTGTVALTKGTHSINVKCQSSGNVTLIIRGYLDLAVVTGATSVNLNSRG